MLDKFRKNKKKITLRIFVIVLLFFLLMPNVTHAHTFWKEAVDLTVGNIFSGIIVPLAGWAMNGAVAALINIAKLDLGKIFSDPVLNNAWIIIRDLCNMFFILILLMIAFSTILRLETGYSLSKSLPKLIIMAILINFSKMIFLLMIDVSQIFMLTFVNAFANAPGNFHAAFQIQKIFSVMESAKSLSASEAVIGYLLGTIFVIIFTITIITLLVMLIARVVMFYILIVLSPLAFLLGAFSQGQQYAAKIWGEFTKYLLNGPVIAFFIWLSLVFIQNFGENIGALVKDITKSGKIFTSLSPEFLLPFLLGIGMLMAGNTVAGQIGGMGAAWGSKKISDFKSKGVNLAKKSFDFGKQKTTDGLKTVTRTGLRAGGAGLMNLGAKDGTLNKAGKFVNAWGNDLRDKRLTAKTDARRKTLEKFGMGTKTQEAFSDLQKTKTMRRATDIVKGAGLAGAGVLTGNPFLIAAGAAAGLGIGARGIIGDRMKEKKVASDEAVIDAEAQKIKNAEKRVDDARGKQEVVKKASESKLSEADISMLPEWQETIAKYAKNGSENPTKEAKEELETKILDNLIKEQEETDKELLNAIDSLANVTKEAETNTRAAQDKIKETKDSWSYKIYSALADMPNKLNIAATKKAVKANEDAEKRTEAIANGEQFYRMSPNTYYSPNGWSSDQKKQLTDLTNGTNKSNSALQKISEQLGQIKNQGFKDLSMGKGQISAVQALKQAIAAHSKSGGDLTLLRKYNIINDLNEIDTDDTSGRKTINDYEKTVIIDD
jgi:hypothetical protein